MSQIDSNAVMAIAARMVEQGIASVRAEAATAIAQKDAELAALTGAGNRLTAERESLLERIEELEVAAKRASFEIEAPEGDDLGEVREFHFGQLQARA